MKLIDKEVLRETVSVSDHKDVVGALSVEKFTEVSTGRYFFVYQFAKGFCNSQVFQA
jgi:hypothetical protein